MTATTAWNIGDRVKPHRYSGFPKSAFGPIYTIEKLPQGARGKNYVAKPEGGGRGLRGPADAFVAADAPDAPDATVAPRLEPIPVVYPGALARTLVSGEERVVVVLRVTNDKAAVTLPGGYDGRCWRGVPLTKLDVIDPARLSVAD